MQYYEWDRLRLNREIDGGHRAFKQEIMFKLFRSYGTKPLWNTMQYDNMSLFYGGLRKERNTFIRNIAEQSKTMKSSLNVSLFDCSESLSELGEELEKEHSAFSYHPYKKDFEALLNDLVAYRDEIREKTEKAHMVEPTNKKVDLILLNIEEPDVLALKNIENLTKLISLLHDSVWERISLVLMIKKATSLPKAMHKKLDWAAYLGSDNDTLCKEAHPELREGPYSKQQEIIGSLYDKKSDKIITLHPLAFTPSDFFIERERMLDEEDEKYKEFLANLDDGTVAI